VKERPENWRSSEPYTPLDMQIKDFDWETLYAHLGEDARDGGNEPRLAEAVARLLQMFLPNARRRIHPDSVGLRVIALAWVLNPAYFEGSPSVNELADQCGVRVAALAAYTGHYSRLIRWRNRGQRHSRNWSSAETPTHRGGKAKTALKRNVPPYGEGSECESTGRDGTGASACERPPGAGGSTVTPSAE